ncbi:MAG: glycosyltransferase, partial [Elusimicrobiota bacterium]
MPSKAETSERCAVCGSAERTFHISGALIRCRNCRAVVWRKESAGPDEPDGGGAHLGAENAKLSAYTQGLSVLARQTTGRKLLDIGAGSGTFLELAAAHGWDPRGIEPDEEHARRGLDRGCRIHIGSLEEFAATERFDAVTLWDSLDVIRDPLEGLSKIRTLLRPGGVVIARIRNGPLHFFIYRFLAFWGVPMLLRLATIHRFGLGAKSLRILFDRAEFEPVEIWNSPLTFGDPYHTARGLGTAALQALKFSLSVAARTATALSFGGLHLGSSLLCLARKPDDRPLILHLITRLDPGGSAESTWALARDWDDRELKVALAAGGRPEGDARPVFWLRHLVRNPSWRDPLALWEIYRLLRRLRPAVLHTHSSKAGVLGRWAAWLAGIPVAHTPHGHVFYGYFGTLKSSFYLLLEKLCAPITERFVALTEGEKNESIGYGLGEAGRWRIVPSGTSLDEDKAPDKAALRGKLGLERDAVWAGSLLRLEHVKGPDVFLEAAGLLKDNARLRFVAIGDGPLRAALRRRIAELGMEKSFILAGHQENIWPWLGALDIYVQPSRNEGMGR